jgi:hypothetical protein
LSELGLLGRVKAYDWTLEIVGIVIIIVIFALFNFGVYLNKSKVNSWLSAVQPVLEENFAQVGVKKGQLIYKDSAVLYTSYATGRVNIKFLTSLFSLISRQNYFLYLTELAISAFTEVVPTPKDSVEVSIAFHDAEKLSKFIFAIVQKDGMSKAREDRYYLSLTKTTESSKLPNEYVFMSESTELNENLVTDDLKDALSQASGILKFLAVTDLPAEKPVTEEEFVSIPKMKLLLTLKTDSKSLAAAQNLIRETINLADRVSKYSLKLEQQKKISSVRTNEVNKIKKAIAEAKAEELREQKLEAERKARRESKLSSEEQDKLDQKKKEKRERRARNKMTKRM